MNQRSILLSLVVATTPAFFANPAMAAVPLVEDVGIAALVTCPTTLATPTAYHSDKIVFAITGPLVAANQADQAALTNLVNSQINRQLDIKVRDNPTRVADLTGKVLSFLGANRNDPTNRSRIRIISVTYAVAVCPRMP